MERYLIKEYYSPERCLDAAITWLAQRGGGTVVTEQKSNIRGCLDMSDSRLDKYFALMKSFNIDFSWRRKGLPNKGNVIAAFTTKSTIEELDASNLDSLLVLGWSKNDYETWEANHNPVILEISEESDE